MPIIASFTETSTIPPTTCTSCGSTMGYPAICTLGELTEATCVSCHEDMSYFCNSCSRHRHERNFIEWNCCGSCATCGCICPYEDEDNEPERGSIIDYSTNVVDYLNTELLNGVRTYGIEIEVETNTTIGRESLADLICGNSKLKHKWVCKYDGSLSTSGVEIVSAPMPYEDLKFAIKELFGTVELTSKVRRSNNCGTHIHVNRESVSSRTIARLWAIYRYGARQYTPMYNLLHALSGRGNVHWANWECEAPVTLKQRRRYGQRMGSIFMNGHYCSITASTHYPTFEMRVFSGVTRASSALRFLETYDALLNICEESHGIEVLKSHEVLVRELGKRLDQYPELKAAFTDTYTSGRRAGEPRRAIGEFYNLLDLKTKKPFDVKHLTEAAKTKQEQRKKKVPKVGQDIPPDDQFFYTTVGLTDPVKLGHKRSLRRLDVIAAKLHGQKEPQKASVFPKFPPLRQITYDGSFIEILGYSFPRILNSTVTKEQVLDAIERLGWEWPCEATNQCGICESTVRQMYERLSREQAELESMSSFSSDDIFPINRV